MEPCNTKHLNSSSMVDLKAELFRKQEEYNKRKLATKDGDYIKGKVSDSNKKKGSLFSKQNKGVLERAERDREVKIEEEDVHARSRKALEAKAKLYDKMTNSSDIPEEDGSGTYLVDFQRKVIDCICEKKEKEREEEDNIPPPQHPDEQWVDYVDSLGRSRRCLKKDLSHLIQQDKDLCGKRSLTTEKKKLDESLPTLLSADMYREIQRKKWEEEEEAKLNEPVGPIHYANVQHNEIRTHGVGFYQFSKVEEERQKQMDTLTKLRDETVDARSKSERLKEKRKAQLETRLAHVKKRRRMKEGYVEETEDEKNEEEIGPKLEEMISQERQVVNDDKGNKLNEKPVEKPVREWDRGKEKMFELNSHRYFEKRREEREPEFAPPSIYKDTQFMPSANISCQSKLYSKKTSDSLEFAPPSIYKDTLVAPRVNISCQSKLDSKKTSDHTITNKIEVKDLNVSDIPLPSDDTMYQGQKETNKTADILIPNFNVPPPGYNPITPFHTDITPPAFITNIPPPSFIPNIPSPAFISNIPSSAFYPPSAPVNLNPAYDDQHHDFNYYQSIPPAHITEQTHQANYSSGIISQTDNSYSTKEPVERMKIIDTRFVDKEDGLDVMEQAENIDSVSYKPGSFTIAALNSANAVINDNDLKDNICEEFHTVQPSSYSGGAVNYSSQTNT
ncbi:coiled-coil domain-containing protein 174 [Patella vulgata]|uniref:coiled-coil domain-containing protein 174 n=1 Tax=Patella vulgata TaxID=6465 RepID=UPI0024A8835A|nr:coiled-coil domain-containing protein 174 [Patella vulgata]